MKKQPQGEGKYVKFSKWSTSDYSKTSLSEPHTSKLVYNPSNYTQSTLD